MNPGDDLNIDEAIVHIRIVDINQEKPKFIIPSTPNATVEIPEVRIQTYILNTKRDFETFSNTF